MSTYTAATSADASESGKLETRSLALIRNATTSLCFLLAGLFLAMMLVALVSPCVQYPLSPTSERYDPALARITSVNAAESYIRSQLPKGAGQAQIAQAIEDFAARRFVHGYSSFSVCDNWLAYLAGGVWFDLRVPIDADDVLRFPMAICTQNTTVIQELLQRFGIPQKSAIFLGNKHIAPLALLDGRWALFDGDLEPRRDGLVFLDDFAKVAHAMYSNRTSQLGGEDFASMFQAAAEKGGIEIAAPTRNMSRTGRMFHAVTWFFSWFGSLVFLALGLLLRRRSPRDDLRPESAIAGDASVAMLANRLHTNSRG